MVLIKEQLQDELDGKNRMTDPPVRAPMVGTPPTVKEVPRAPWANIAPAWVMILVWICISSGVILYNKQIMDPVEKGGYGFPYPVTLTTLHLAFQSLATTLLKRYTNLVNMPSATPTQSQAIPLPVTTAPKETGAQLQEQLLQQEGSPQKNIYSKEVYWRNVMPICVLFSLSLLFSNWAYLVAYIHMLKSFSPVAVTLVSFILGLKQPSQKLFIIAQFNLTGFLIQCSAVVIEALRVTSIQLILHNFKLNPLSSLMLFAPPSFVINAVLILPIEGFAPFGALRQLGFLVIFSNCFLAFALNISATYLIGLSSLILSLSKVVKDIILIAGSAVLYATPITPLQFVGYFVSLIGLLWYKTSAF
ncbi:TPT-domain-containing protein [Atractiella rhizophila]|nr:TPT-domain-containing protein [Atractiella rhizophila]